MALLSLSGGRYTVDNKVYMLKHLISIVIISRVVFSKFGLRSKCMSLRIYITTPPPVLCTHLYYLLGMFRLGSKYQEEVNHILEKKIIWSSLFTKRLLLWLANLRPFLTNGKISVGIVWSIRLNISWFPNVLIEVGSLPVICDESLAGHVKIVLWQLILSNALLLSTTVLLQFFIFLCWWATHTNP